MDYAETIGQIRTCARRTIEDRFRIGALMADLVDSGHGLDQVVADSGLSRPTALGYLGAHRVWGDVRIADCSKWSLYVEVAGWPPAVLEESGVVELAATEGERVVEEWQGYAESEQRRAVRRLPRRSEERMAADTANRHLWDAYRNLKLVDWRQLPDAKRRALADSLALVVGYAERLRKELTLDPA